MNKYLKALQNILKDLKPKPDPKCSNPYKEDILLLKELINHADLLTSDELKILKEKSTPLPLNHELHGWDTCPRCHTPLYKENYCYECGQRIEREENV